ncbi:hypothetical protein [Hugenholtzia roseola]|uniref:hypothetical protein n=1 Tax=Hugenholtzia roseola TaxID=1002 RepID=UPI0004022347|nr:hypothetical protein [Hugenholtzia roseola]
MDRVITIAANAAYDLYYHADKNRFYLTLKGFWKSVDVAPNYLSDWQKALSLSTEGFTILTDLRTSKVYTPEVAALHEKAQKMVVDAGLSQTAEVLPNSVFMDFQTRYLSEKSHMPTDKFTEIEAAEAYLDSLQILAESRKEQTATKSDPL